MLRLLADENFNNLIVRGLRQRCPELDLVRVQDVGLYNVDDPGILDWAAQENRIVLTHDVKTMKDFAYDRVLARLPMPGVFEIKKDTPIGPMIEELVLLVECSQMEEWNGQVVFLPL